VVIYSIVVDLAVNRPSFDLVPAWRERAWGTKQTIVLRLHLKQFGALGEHVESRVEIYHSPETHDSQCNDSPSQLDLPPALPCLRHLALTNGGNRDLFSYLEAKAYITSLCHRLFTRRQTRRTNSVARFHLEFHYLAFDKRPRVMNCVQTLVLRECTFATPWQILQFLEAARFTFKYLEYIFCWVNSLDPLPPTRLLTFPLLLTRKHESVPMTPYLPSILPFLSCPALHTLTTHGNEAVFCTAAQFPALKSSV